MEAANGTELPEEGRVRSFLGLPLNLFQEVLAFLSLYDILRLMRTSVRLRDLTATLFRSQNAASLQEGFAQSDYQLAPLPDPEHFAQLVVRNAARERAASLFFLNRRFSPEVRAVVLRLDVVPDASLLNVVLDSHPDDLVLFSRKQQLQYLDPHAFAKHPHAVSSLFLFNLSLNSDYVDQMIGKLDALVNLHISFSGQSYRIPLLCLLLLRLVHQGSI